MWSAVWDRGGGSLAGVSVAFAAILSPWLQNAQLDAESRLDHGLFFPTPSDDFVEANGRALTWPRKLSPSATETKGVERGKTLARTQAWGAPNWKVTDSILQRIRKHLSFRKTHIVFVRFRRDGHIRGYPHTKRDSCCTLALYDFAGDKWRQRAPFTGEVHGKQFRVLLRGTDLHDQREFICVKHKDKAIAESYYAERQKSDGGDSTLRRQAIKRRSSASSSSTLPSSTAGSSFSSHASTTSGHEGEFDQTDFDSREFSDISHEAPSEDLAPDVPRPWSPESRRSEVRGHVPKAPRSQSASPELFNGRKKTQKRVKD